ncbi:MAG: helix-turn-helix domain-containing protein [Coprococcus sp.]
MIGERLSELRSKKNMTQEEFAEYMNVSRQSVSKWELNKALPDVEKLMKISDLFEVSLDYLLKGADHIFPCNTNSESIETQQSQDAFSDDFPDETITDTPNPDADDLSEAPAIDENKKSHKKSGITISLILTSVLLICFLILLIKCITCQIWNVTGNKKELVKVEKIYSQYSLADICIYDESGKSVSKKIFLDTKGIREGDYISCFVNQDKNRILTDYTATTFVIIISISLVLLGIIILLIREIKSHE